MEIKKGIEPKKEDNTQTQLHDSRIINVCLLFSAIGVLCILAGHYSHNEMLFGLGLGLACSMAIIDAMAVLKDEED